MYKIWLEESCRTLTEKERGYLRVTRKDGLRGGRNKKKNTVGGNELCSFIICIQAHLYQQISEKKVVNADDVNTLLPYAKDFWELLKVSWGEQSRKTYSCSRKDHITSRHWVTLKKRDVNSEEGTTSTGFLCSSNEQHLWTHTHINKHTLIYAHLHAHPPPGSRPYGGLHRNRSFVTHDVPGQGMHYRWAQTACLSEHSPHS